MKINIADIVGKGYASFWNFKGRYRIVKGGRGSKKSTTTAIWIIYNMMKYPLANTLVVRQTFNAHLDSTWAQLRWATNRLGVSHLWTFTKSPLAATFNPTGQKILFRGLDDALAITSITVDNGVLCWVWFEESFQIKSEDAFNKVDMSIRGEMPEGYFKQITMTFNPWSDKHWIKRRFFDNPDEDVYVNTTTYECNEWLDENDIALFEKMKVNHPSRYKVEGLGHWGVIEGQVYDNWEIEDFDYREIDGKLLVGCDFGFTHDPTTLITSLLDEERKKIYIYDEHFQKGMVNTEIADLIKRKGLDKKIIIADSSEPKSIEEIKRCGIQRIRGSAKGKDSINQGIQKLKQYDIVIHPSCENIINEFECYCWDKDRMTGDGINKPIDDFNHGLDALRYSLQCYDSRTKLQSLPIDMFGL